MVQPGIGGLDTPRKSLGDTTHLSNQQFDFDISQEQSFQSPTKDTNLLSQFQNGRRATNLRTPRSRVALNERRNIPSLSRGEFTPLLKSATRNSARRIGKENIPQTPAFLDNIPEDLSPLPIMNSSAYGDSRNGSYIAGTPIPQIESSSAASTPVTLLQLRNERPGVLQDSNQLSLREQENVIDRIEKENFGLKLKIHFLEEALRKAGPGFSEAALKENTELKVDKVTMQKELHRYRKTLSGAENDVELYRQQLIELQEKIKRKHADEGQKEELDQLRKVLEKREGDLDRLKSQEGRYEEFEDKIQDLEAEMREKDRLIDDGEDEMENLKDELEKQASTISDLSDSLKKAQRRAVELEEQTQVKDELDEAKETIEEFEAKLERLGNELENAKEDQLEAVKAKDQAEGDLEELQHEMANKSITTKGLNRQIEEKANRLQDELEELREKHVDLENHYASKAHDVQKLQAQIQDLKDNQEARERKHKVELETIQNEKNSSFRDREASLEQLEVIKKEMEQQGEEKNLLQIRHDALTTESLSLQRDLERCRGEIGDLEGKLDQEKGSALASERELRSEYKNELDRLQDEIEDLRAESRAKERENDEQSDKWDSERKNLASLKQIAEENAAGLQKMIDKLQEAEGTLSGNEVKLHEALQSEKTRHQNQEALLTRQINQLNDDVQARRKALDDVKSELSSVREELRLGQREQRSLTEKVEGLEDEVEILQTNLDDESDQANQNLSVAKKESENLRKQIQTLKQDVSRAESATVDARAEIEAFQSDMQSGEGNNEQLNLRLREVESQLSRTRHEKQGLQDQLGALNIEIHSLRISLSDIEAERDEIHSQLKALRQQDEETFRLDQERIDLRTSKMKLDSEVRRLRDENRVAISQQEAIEKELQHEIDRSTAEESRLKSEIHDLQKILKGSSEKRDLASAKKTIQDLEQRVRDLETQILTGDDNVETANEASIIRRDLNAARQKETDYLQREAAQKEVFRGLKRQISELERKAHDAEISRFVSSSPRSSVNGSARKNEVLEVRAQLASAHQSLKDLRGQLREAEKDAARKINVAKLEFQTQSTAWESDKDQLERSVDEARYKIEELTAKSTASEATITRLRSKIERLEKALQEERLNTGEDRTMVQERRDLHEMLRETQLQAESLEIVVQERENTIAAIQTRQHELRSQLNRVREERSAQKSKTLSIQEQLDHLERKYRKAQRNWDVERQRLHKGVRFVNTSLSANDENDILELQHAIEDRNKIHVKELRGMSMQIEWLRARCKREETFRDAAAYAKRYMGLQIDMFEACNKADLALLESAGIERPIKPRERRPTFRTVAYAIRATVRMQRGAERWGEKKKIQERITEKVNAMKRAQFGYATATPKQSGSGRLN